MIFDNTTLLSDRQAITVTAPSTNVIDLGPLGTVKFASGPLRRDIGMGTPIPIVVQVVQQFTAAGAATMQVALQVDDNAAFTTPKTVATYGSNLALADLKPGARFSLNYIPKGTDERYLRVNYTVGTGPMTAGQVFAGIVMGDQDAPYP
jgi:hypothetical protein